MAARRRANRSSRIAGVVDRQDLAFANDRTAANDQFVDMAHGGAREQEIARIEIGAQPLGIDRVPVEHQDIGRLAGRERAAVVFVGDREASVLERHSQHCRAIDIGRERGALVEQVGEPHFAERVVVLVEASSRRGRAPPGSRA